MVNSNLKLLLKYLVFALIVFLITAYLPTYKLKISDQIIIVLIAVISYVVLDFLSSNNEPMTNYDTSNNSSCGCKETFDAPPPVIEQPASVLDTQQVVLPTQPTQPIQTVQPTQPVQIVQPPQTVPPPNNENDIQYSDYPLDMHRPLGTYDKTFTNGFEHGFTYLDTDRWSVPMKKPPICITDKPATVFPALTSGYPVDVKLFADYNRVYPHQQINTKYINERVNASDYKPDPTMKVPQISN